MPERIDIGVIGGSGLYQMSAITESTSLRVETPFGPPSAEIVLGTLHGKRVAFLPRHGIGHVYSPSTIPYRANIYALKSIGVRFKLAVSACGSLREDYAPGHIVVPDQLIDQTRSGRGGRSFFDNGLVAHISVADPFCNQLRQVVSQAAQKSGATIHREGTFVTIEGPRFSTRGESHLFRQWGCSIIGMTTSPEAFLAREAEISYACIAHVTDYDVWHSSEEPVTAEMVMVTLNKNLDAVQRTVAETISLLDTQMGSEAHTALDEAIFVDRRQVPDELYERLKPLLQRRFAGA
jgi:5'-methylthioadenosine phosphorylase